MRRFVDTNVLLRALVQDDPQRSDASIALIRRINRGEELAVTNHSVLTEVVFVLLKSYRTSKADTRQLVTSILNMKGLDVPHRDLFQEALDVFERLNISFGDAYVAVLMKDQGIDEIYSWDTEFDRVPWLTRITPPSPDG